VAGVIAQRLVRRLCDRCAKPTEPTRSELAFLGIDRGDLRGTRFHAGVGCPRCNGAGYKGRLAIHEVLLPGDEFRDAVLHRRPANELRRLARNTAVFLTLQEDGLLKAAAGHTSLAEVIQNAPRDTEARTLATLRSMAKEGKG
jgi:type IV pilus assembly protein PilB